MLVIYTYRNPYKVSLFQAPSDDTAQQSIGVVEHVQWYQWSIGRSLSHTNITLIDERTSTVQSERQGPQCIIGEASFNVITPCSGTGIIEFPKFIHSLRSGEEQPVKCINVHNKRYKMPEQYQ